MTAGTWRDRAAVVAGDRDAGASEILARLVPIVVDARREAPETLDAVARAVLEAQPAMAGLAFLLNAARADRERPGQLDDAVARIARAPRALTRVAVEAWDGIAGPAPWRVVTWSYSSAVAAVLEALAARGALEVTCAEGRPRLEGRRLAERLASTGIAVIVATDAAATRLVRDASALLVGADAVTPAGWINKAGTAAVAAMARRAHVPAVVLATREKGTADPAFLDRALAVTGAGAEVWEAPPAGIAVADPTFELTPWDLADFLITDRDIVLADGISAESFS